ncbi:OmpA family protein [Adhaeribacter aquaticus]|uniref:OmpA family protein n=1 Tax=Adhaeribacter aquaticus TaxID=299567 RepID=UPI0003FEB11D|nr:OmpA family protein [Adhaeribacter aquaticus]
MKITRILFSLSLVIAVLFSSCKSSNPYSTSNDSTRRNPETAKGPVNRTQRGGLIGGGAGAVLGGVAAKVMGKSTAAGAIIGAAVGGTAGAVIGRRMDKQAEELRNDMKGAKVERVGEGIKITFASGILFATNSATLQSNSITDINTLAETLKKYGDTNVIVEGHTDATGSDAINIPLSENRAKSVAAQLLAQGVESSRITTQGFGSSVPVADNSTEAGKQANRRVEVAIFANEKLQKAAERGDIK